MTADELQRLVRLIGNAGWCRHWLHYNYPQTEPWEMAISCVAIRMSDSGGRRLSDPVVLKDLEVRGFRPEVSTDGLIIYVIARTNEDGTPFRSKGDDDPPPSESRKRGPATGPVQQRAAAAEARGLVHAAAAEALTEEGLSAKERVSARRAVLCGMWTARGVCRYCGCRQAVDGDSPHEEDCDGRVALAAIGRTMQGM